MISADDIVEIHQVLSRYSVAMDLRRWELMDEVFLPDAALTINGDRLRPAARGIALIRACIELCSYTSHLNGTTLVEDVDGQVRVTTSVRAWHRGGERDDQVLDCYGRYLDVFVKTEAGWRIARRDEQVPVAIGATDLFDGAGPTVARLIEETAAEFPGG